VVAPTVFDDVDALLGASPRDLGATAWRTLEPSQLTAFAAATGSPEAEPGPGSGPGPQDAAPPLLVLALTNLFLPELLDVRGASNGINYGAGRVSFATPVRPGDRVRGRAALVDAAEVPGGVQTTIEIRVEVEGCHDPACVVESLSRWMR
jgi:hypothetical protein